MTSPVAADSATAHSLLAVQVASTGVADSRRIRGLVAELWEIRRDRELAGRYIEPGTWLRELAVEEHEICRRIDAEMAAVSSANIEEEQ